MTCGVCARIGTNAIGGPRAHSPSCTREGAITWEADRFGHRLVFRGADGLVIRSALLDREFIERDSHGVYHDANWRLALEDNARRIREGKRHNTVPDNEPGHYFLPAWVG